MINLYKSICKYSLPISHRHSNIISLPKNTDYKNYKQTFHNLKHYCIISKNKKKTYFLVQKPVFMLFWFILSSIHDSQIQSLNTGWVLYDHIFSISGCIKVFPVFAQPNLTQRVSRIIKLKIIYLIEDVTSNQFQQNCLTPQMRSSNWLKQRLGFSRIKQ